jgi:hypothetical protein
LPAAGVLSLLLEAGDPQTVVAAGEEWLASHRRDRRARDVALSTALAHRRVAEALVKRHNDAISADAMLRVAADLARQHRAPPALQAELAAAAAELAPAVACQLAALPLERFQERERGLQVQTGHMLEGRLMIGHIVCVASCVLAGNKLAQISVHGQTRSFLFPSHCQMAISVLTDNSGVRRGMGKQQFLDVMAAQLTAQEQVGTQGATPRALVPTVGLAWLRQHALLAALCVSAHGSNLACCA